MLSSLCDCIFFFFNDTATTEIYTLSLHDALPICARRRAGDRSTRRGGSCERRQRRGLRGREADDRRRSRRLRPPGHPRRCQDRKSTRLNSSHLVISYAVFCLKKKRKRPDPVAHTL